MRHRLNKKDRVTVAGKKNNKAIRLWGKPKEKWAEERERHGIK